MAELTLSKDEVVGIKKEIEEDSLELIFNALQSDIYSFPIKSFIRETISNGLDSNIEKNVFRKINDGDPVEKYYLQRQDDKLLKDSEYNPSYYDINYLSTDDVVTVEYITDSPRDRVIIKDNGVGLGGRRLKMYFKIGASSKRNFLTARGLYGLGSKSALATGADYYIMTTVYNGYKTSFMIYNRDYENITPESSEGKIEVWKVTMADNTIVDKNIYWEKTDELNSVTIEVEIKKHNRITCINAVKDQFQYFNGNVRLGVTDNNYTSWDNLNDTPEFESDNLLIPRYSTYYSPHILVDGIAYGVVSWSELELEDRQGKVALKVTANEVDITQSRESLKWTDKTKNTILRAIKKAEEEASEYVRSKISIDNEENIFLLNSSYNTISSNNNSVISTFSKFLRMHRIKPFYKITLEDNGEEYDEEDYGDLFSEGKAFNPNIINAPLGPELFEFMFYSFDLKRVYIQTEKNKLKLKSETVHSFDSISSSIIVYGEDIVLGSKLANHLLTKYNVNSFIYIRKNVTRVRGTIRLGNAGFKYETERIKDFTLNIIKKYCTLNLDDYEVTFDDVEFEETVLEDNVVNLAKIRKLNKEILWYQYDTRLDYSSIVFDRFKHTLKISDLKDYTKLYNKLIIVPASYNKLGKMLLVMNQLKKDPNLICVFVAEDNIKYFEELGGIHIKNYFRTPNINTGELMIGEKLVEINTYYQMSKLKEKYSSFFDKSNLIESLTSIDKIKFNSFHIQGGVKIKELLKNSLSDEKAVEDIFSYLDVLAEFQTVVGTKDKELIAAKSLELFSSDKIHNVYAYDKDYIDSVEEELERISCIAPILRNLTEYNITDEQTKLLNLLITTIQNNS